MKMVVMSSVYSKPPNNAVFILISEVHLNTTCGWNRCDISSFTWTLIGRWELSLGQLEIIFGSSTERLQIAAEVTRSLWNFLIKWKPSAAASTSLPSDPNDLGSRSTQHLEIVGKYSMLISIIFHVPLNRRKQVFALKWTRHRHRSRSEKSELSFQLSVIWSISIWNRVYRE